VKRLSAKTERSSFLAGNRTDERELDLTYLKAGTTSLGPDLGRGDSCDNTPRRFVEECAERRQAS